MTEQAGSIARERLEAFLQKLERTNVDDLIVIALPAPDRRQRADQLAAATLAASRTGRDALLNEARLRARELLVAGFARRAYDPTWFGLNWGRSLGRSADRAALLAAAEDAAAAAVVEDLIDVALVDDLESPFMSVAGMRGSAPAVNPMLARSRIGVGGRLALLVVIALTFTWGLAGELLQILIAAIKSRADGIIDF